MHRRLDSGFARRRAPPIATGLKMGLHVSGGTDSDQVAPYNPFVS